MWLATKLRRWLRWKCKDCGVQANGFDYPYRDHRRAKHNGR